MWPCHSLTNEWDTFLITHNHQFRYIKCFFSQPLLRIKPKFSLSDSNVSASTNISEQHFLECTHQNKATTETWDFCPANFPKPGSNSGSQWHQHKDSNYCDFWNRRECRTLHIHQEQFPYFLIFNEKLRIFTFCKKNVIFSYFYDRNALVR